MANVQLKKSPVCQKYKITTGINLFL